MSIYMLMKRNTCELPGGCKVCSLEKKSDVSSTDNALDPHSVIVRIVFEVRRKFGRRIIIKLSTVLTQHFDKSSFLDAIPLSLVSESVSEWVVVSDFGDSYRIYRACELVTSHVMIDSEVR